MKKGLYLKLVIDDFELNFFLIEGIKKVFNFWMFIVVLVLNWVLVVVVFLFCIVKYINLLLNGNVMGNI